MTKIIFIVADKISMRKIFNYLLAFSISLSLAVIANLFTNEGGVLFAAEKKQAQADPRDIRVLIDVSGSMKKNDPKNLRSPALRLLVGLLPSGSSAAVWNFGTTVKELVKSAQVDEKWKLQAKKASKHIHSRDLFTNIGQALSTASQSWIQSKEKIEPGNRNLILLTDGMVDISADNKKNIKERERILADLLPQISKKQTQIHTIALSNKADFDFLKKLSTKTDGSFENADNAEALERLFLHLFEKATKPDTLPLIENQFKVDDSVYEMTLLVFKDKTAKNQTTEVVDPSGNAYTKQTAPKYVKWQSEKNYDLVTIQKPFVGDWKINASIDPDNRVLVVTNLKIKTNHLPNNVFLGEEIDLKLFLMDQKEIITDDEFLHLTSISVSKKENNNKAGKKMFLHDNGLRDDKKADDGLFDVTLGKSFKTGKNAFLIRASSDTFARELLQTFTVHDIPLLSAELEVIEKDGLEAKRVRISPNLEYINPKNIKVSAELFNENGNSQIVALKNDNPQQIEWYFETNKIAPNENYHIVFHMQSHSIRGRPIRYTSKKIQLNLNRIIRDSLDTESKDEQDIKVTITQNEDETSIINDDADDIIKPEQMDSLIEPEGIIESNDDENKIDWTMGLIITAIVNVIIALLAWFFYRRWKKGQDTDLIDLTGDMG